MVRMSGVCGEVLELMPDCFTFCGVRVLWTTLMTVIAYKDDKLILNCFSFCSVQSFAENMAITW